MSFSEGRILSEQAYAQGKMLDHSSWAAVLPRRITPSDIDMVFDDSQNGRVCFCELSSQFKSWRDVQYGQRVLYSQLVVGGCGSAFAVLLSHSVPKDRQINTLTDIDSFQIMRFAALLGYATSEVHDGSRWQEWVEAFYKGRTDI